MKKIIIFSALSSMLAISGVQAEGHGTINFTGKVNSQTCNASINGSSSAPATVVLPTVQASILSGAGKTAGQTAFKINVTDCDVSTLNGSGTVKAYFEKGADVDSNGRLINTDNSGASNVVLELVDGTSNSPITVGDISQTNNNYVTISNGSATLPYSVRYYATGIASAGVVKSDVTYSLIYY